MKNPNDGNEIHRILFDDDSTKEEDFRDLSGTDSGDDLQVQDQNSETDSPVHKGRKKANVGTNSYKAGFFPDVRS